MPTVIVEHPLGEQSIEVDQAAALMDVCDEHEIALGLSCRATTCGSCAVTVIEGAELLEKAIDREEELLRATGAATGRRFACAIRVRPGNGLVRLRISASSAHLPSSRG